MKMSEPLSHQPTQGVKKTAIRWNKAINSLHDGKKMQSSGDERLLARTCCTQASPKPQTQAANDLTACNYFNIEKPSLW